MTSKISKTVLAVAAGLALAATAFAGGATHDHSAMAAAAGVPADVALKGVPMKMSPYDLPHQFRTQLRGDVADSSGVLTIKQEGKDVLYTFEWKNLTSDLISAHFHNAPQAHVGARAQSVCGVVGESPACPTGTSGMLSGVWQNADVAAIEAGMITFAAHTQVYPAPIGELAVYIPAKQSQVAAANVAQ